MTIGRHHVDAKATFWLGVIIVVATSSVQGVVLYNNASFTLSAFGWAFLIIYLAAATCYIVLPWIAATIEEFAHVGGTRLALFTFCFWITFEEHLHASHTFHPPEGATAIASLFVSTDGAKYLANFLVVCALLGVVEFLHHLHHHGATLVKKNIRVVKK